MHGMHALRYTHACLLRTLLAMLAMYTVFADTITDLLDALHSARYVLHAASDALLWQTMVASTG